MTGRDAADLLAAVLGRLAMDPESDVVWQGVHEDRRGARMRQQTRDFTTVWFDIGERTVRHEAYLLPAPPHRPEMALAWCLRRNWGSWPSTIAADGDGDLFVVGRVDLESFDERWIDMALGSVHEIVETSFRPLLGLSYLARETSP